jgi:hypothetical protein
MTEDTYGVFRVRSNSGGTTLDVNGANVRLSRRGLEADVAVYEFEYGETLRSLHAFFSSLASEWRGWSGERVSSTLEGEFTIKATHDGSETVELTVTLRQLESGGDGSWRATASLFVDAGGLDALARGAARASP